ncbi:MAG: hypothetical protein NZ694_02585, partial [Tepidimonas sp.]|nr:hypothetical protein [Tepidimonas sp.]
QDAAAPLKLVRRIASGRTPSHLWIDSGSTVAYATMQDSDELVAVDLAAQSIRWRARVGKLPADVYLTADDRTLLVALTGDRFVEAYDVSGGPARLIQRIETGAGAHAFRARGRRRGPPASDLRAQLAGCGCQCDRPCQLHRDPTHSNRQGAAPPVSDAG